jgi:sugar lactone lactonase YvrE
MGLRPAWLWLLVVVCVLAGCVPNRVVENKRYLWPASAQAAKIEYLEFFASADDFKRNRINWYEEVILGKKPSSSIFAKPYALDARFGKVAITDIVLRQVFLIDFSREQIAPLETRIDEKVGIGSGPLTPTGIAFAGPDELWVVNSLAAQVLRFNLAGTYLGKIGGEGLRRPTSIAIDIANRRVVVVDPSQHRLAVFTLDGTFLNYLGERGTAPGQFNFPLDADFDSSGDLFVLDALNARVQRFRWDGQAYRYVSHFGERGTTAGSFQIPKSIAVSPAGHVYVTDSLANKVVVFDRDGGFLLVFGGKYVAKGGQFAPGGLNMPTGIAVDEHNGIWIADSFNRMVHHFQYLDADYLRTHPISPEQVVLPPLDALIEEQDQAAPKQGQGL